MLFDKFWEITSNMVSLNCYSSILKRKYIDKKVDNNNFYYKNKFFHVMIEVMVMTLCMHKAEYSTIHKL